MGERCQVCGKEILAWHEGFSVKWTMDASDNVTIMGGKCGSCGRLCCAECLRNGACPTCRERLKRCGGSVL